MYPPLLEVTRGVKYSQTWMKGWHCSKRAGSSKPVVEGKKMASIKTRPFASSMPSLHSALIMMDLQLMGIRDGERQTCLLHRRTCIVILCAVLHGVRQLWVAWLQGTKTNLETMAAFFTVVWRYLTVRGQEFKLLVLHSALDESIVLFNAIYSA